MPLLEDLQPVYLGVRQEAHVDDLRVGSREVPRSREGKLVMLVSPLLIEDIPGVMAETDWRSARYRLGRRMFLPDTSRHTMGRAESSRLGAR